jgi:hypothetical protein
MIADGQTALLVDLPLEDVKAVVGAREGGKAGGT